MAGQTRASNQAQRIVFSPGDFVLYRDPELFWAGKPNHTFICRVQSKCPYTDEYSLKVLVDQRPVLAARPAYMRLLSPEDAMRDIDTAPLNDPNTAAMAAASVAWLRQQFRDRASELG